MVWAVTLFVKSDVRAKLTCKFTDYDVELSPTHLNRGAAVACLLKRPADQNGKYVPQLLMLVDDKVTHSQRLGATEAYTTSIGYLAEGAIRYAIPQADNVEPIVKKLIKYANEFERPSSKTERPNGARAQMLFELLIDEYVKAGLTQSVATSFIVHADEITNDAFWRYRESPYGPGYAYRVHKLTAGKSSMAAAQYAKHKAEQDAESAAPPQIRSLLPAKRASLASPSPESIDALEIRARRNGRTWKLDMEKNRFASGWATVWLDERITCDQVLPVLCIAPPTPGDAPIRWDELESLGGFSNTVDARIAPTKPVAGTALISRNAGDALCSAQRGPEWRMAENNDSRAGRLLPNAWRMVRFHYTKGGVLSARATDEDREAMKATQFWVASSDPENNCWVK